LAELELDRDTLLERYAGLVPQALDALDAEQRHQLYKMLRLRVVTIANGIIEMKGVLCGGVRFLESEMTRRCTTQFTQGPEPLLL
jgi:hypothetical protein